MIKNVLYLASGVAIGYFVAVRHLEKDYHERLKSEIDDVKEEERLKYRRKAAQDYVSDPAFLEDAVKAAEALNLYQGVTADPSVFVEEMTETKRLEEEQAAEADEEEVEQEPDLEDDGTYPEEPPAEDGQWEKWSKTLSGEDDPKPTPPVSIIPEQPSGAVNYNRISTAPKEPTTAEKEAAYVPEVIDKDVYDVNDSGYEQTTLTYYVGDDRLANIYDQVFTDDDRLAVLSPEIFALLKSPEARGGENVVYIRNDVRQREFEIIVSNGMYSDEVGDVVYATG